MPECENVKASCLETKQEMVDQRIKAGEFL